MAVPSPWRFPVCATAKWKSIGRTNLPGQPFTNGEGQIHERLIFLAQVTKKGEVFRDRDEQGSPIVIERVRPFPIQSGRSEAQNGIVIFPDTQRRPEVPKGKVALPGAPN